MACTVNVNMTFGNFLRGISPLVSEDAVNYVCMKRRLSPSLNLRDMSMRDIELGEATTYYWLSNLPVGGATEKVSDGGWSHSEGGWTVSKANIEEWVRKYRSLFGKWDEPLIDGSASRTIRIINF